LQLEVVLPSGQLVTASPCQNTDLFWAIRGGGGSTLGIITNFTTKLWPSEPVSSYIVNLESLTDNNDGFWDALAYILSQMPNITKSGAMCYSTAQPAQLLNVTALYQLQGIFVAPIKTLAETVALLSTLVNHINSTFSPRVIATDDGGQSVKLTKDAMVDNLTRLL
jgi:hypothetical protein